MTAREIKIVPAGRGEFHVGVIEGTTSSKHTVSVPAETIERLGWNGTPEELIRKSFDFLLQHEPKESILSAFEISAIGRYFPEYDDAVRRGFKKVT